MRNDVSPWKDADWRAQARCLGTDPSLFFPVGSTGEPLVQEEAAKRMCGSCDVRRPCLNFALETNQDTGVWGGTTEDERRALRRNWLRTRRQAALTRAT